MAPELLNRYIYIVYVHQKVPLPFRSARTEDWVVHKAPQQSHANILGISQHTQVRDILDLDRGALSSI